MAARESQGKPAERMEPERERRQTLPEYLRQLRISSHYRQNFVASRLNISRQTYSHYETGRIRPPAGALYGLARLYGIPVENLLSRMMLGRYGLENREEGGERRPEEKEHPEAGDSAEDKKYSGGWKHQEHKETGKGEPPEQIKPPEDEGCRRAWKGYPAEGNPPAHKGHSEDRNLPGQKNGPGNGKPPEQNHEDSGDGNPAESKESRKDLKKDSAEGERGSSLEIRLLARFRSLTQREQEDILSIMELKIKDKEEKENQDAERKVTV